MDNLLRFYKRNSFALEDDFSQLDFNKAFVFWFITWFYKKRFYNKETIA